MLFNRVQKNIWEQWKLKPAFSEQTEASVGLGEQGWLPGGWGAPEEVEDSGERKVFLGEVEGGGELRIAGVGEAPGAVHSAGTEPAIPGDI